jgi:hypothetical protein
MLKLLLVGHIKVLRGLHAARGPDVAQAVSRTTHLKSNLARILA